MSAGEALTDDDEALLEHLDEQSGEELSLEEVESHLKEMRGEFRELQANFRKLRHSVDQRLTALEERDPVNDDDAPPLVRYTQLSPEDREEELKTSEFIAVTIHDQWGDIAWSLGGGSNYAGEKKDTRIGVDTKSKANAKYNPSRLKHRLKKELGWDPASNQVYRGLKTLADISGGEEVVDDTTGRVQVMGGLYEYREMATADGQDTKRVVWRSE